MGQKIHPFGYRLGIIEGWESRWFAEGKLYSEFLKEDHLIRKFIKKRFTQSDISQIEIERTGNRIRIIINTARPGMIIGRQGAILEELRKDLERITQKQVSPVIGEVKNPSLDAQLVARNIASQIEKRVAHKRAMKQAIFRAMRAGAQGIRVSCSGRLGGSEIARTEWYREGRVPLHTIRADIDYGITEAVTRYGRIGIKVWVYKGDSKMYSESVRMVIPGVDAKTG